MLQSEAALEQSRAQQTNLKQQRARPSKEKKIHSHEEEHQNQKGSSNSKETHIKKTARGLTTVEIIRANSDPYTSSKLRRQKS